MLTREGSEGERRQVRPCTRGQCDRRGSRSLKTDHSLLISVPSRWTILKWERENEEYFLLWSQISNLKKGRKDFDPYGWP